MPRLMRSASVKALLSAALTVAALVGAPVAAGAQTRNVIASWDANVDPVTAGYQVMVGLAPGSPVATLDVGLATQAALPLPPGARYYVSVRAYSGMGQYGMPTEEVVVDLSLPPGPPAAFRADVSGATATLRWSEPSIGGLALNYLLSVGTTPGSADLLAGASLGNVRSISGDLPPGRYYARLQGANPLGVGAPADLVFDIAGGYRPLAPAALAGRWSGSTVQLTWVAPTGPSADLPTAYVIEAGNASGSSDIGVVNVGGATSFSAAVPPGTYFVRVRGISARGVSDPSNEIVLRR